VSAAQLGAPALFALASVPMQSWPAEECPLCEAGVPINPRLGKGAAFLAEGRR
jgi:orotate phosphoribosyltransferase